MKLINNPGVLHGLVIRIKLIRYDGEANGFEVLISQHDRAVKYIYRFPASRSEVFKAVLTQIGKQIAYTTSGRRHVNKRHLIPVPVRRLPRPTLRDGKKRGRGHRDDL